MKVLIDMNMSPRWVEYLAEAGVDAVHWSSVGQASAPDYEIMATARRADCVILTHDLDFGAALATSRASGPSGVQLRIGNIRPDQAGPAVVEALRQCADELEQGALLTIDAARFRTTLLPLRR